MLVKLTPGVNFINILTSYVYKCKRSGTRLLFHRHIHTRSMPYTSKISINLLFQNLLVKYW